jgi:hypothetical protein
MIKAANDFVISNWTPHSPLFGPSREVELKIRILLFSSVAFKTANKKEDFCLFLAGVTQVLLPQSSKITSHSEVTKQYKSFLLLVGRIRLRIREAQKHPDQKNSFGRVLSFSFPLPGISMILQKKHAISVVRLS